MSMQFQTGFEGTGGNTESEKWDGGLNSVSTSLPRSGTYRCGFNGSNTTYKNVAASAGKVIGVAYKFASNGLPSTGNEDSLVTFSESGTTHIALYLYTTGADSYLRIKRGSTTLASDTVRQIFHSDWTYIELKVEVNDSTGTYEVRVNGVQVAALTATGQDTRNGGTGVIDRVYFNSPIGVVAHGDDIYIASTTGGTITDFVCTSTKTFRVQGVIASSGNGTNIDFTPSTGSDHGANVDDTNPNGDTDYNSSLTVNHIDTYNYAALSLPAGSTVVAVGVNSWVKKTDAGARGFKTAIRSAGTNYTPNAEINPTTTYDWSQDIFEQDPATAAAWAESAVDAAEFGAQVTS